VRQARRGGSSSRPGIRSWDTILLWVRSGGMCEFPGCNRDLTTHRPSGRTYNLADRAHIAPLRNRGPRGQSRLPMAQRNAVGNLLLMCPICHKKVIDADPGRYPEDMLREWKAAHEQRIRSLLRFGAKGPTVAIRLSADVRSRAACISDDEMCEATLQDDNRWPTPVGAEGCIDIDLSGFPRKKAAEYWPSACARIDEVLAANDAILRRAAHRSVFALASVPLLVYLGYQLGNTAVTSFHQRGQSHSWAWSRRHCGVRFRARLLQRGSDRRSAVLVASLSKKVVRRELPAFVTRAHSIYELEPAGVTPSRTLFKSSADLEEFRAAYRGVLDRVRTELPQVATLHLFAAAPVTAALACGADLLREAAPGLAVYHWSGSGRYELALEVNT